MESKELKEMKKEFSVKKFKEVTVYTLESASSGGSSAGGIASVSMPMGGVRKRGDNLIAQEANKDKVPATTPRNFVAKNAKTSGAGSHKDKKKAEKQGDFKHKKSYSDSLQEMTDAEVAKIRSDAAAHLTAQLNKPKEVPKKKSFMQQVGDKQIAMAKGAWKGLTGQNEDHATANNGWGRGAYDTYAGGRHGRGVAEEDDVQQEIGMAGSELYGAAKHAKQLLALIQQHGENGLEAWQQSKITKAADYLNAVLQSLDYDTNGEEQSVAEGVMSDIDYEIGEMMGKYIKKYQDGLLDADHFMSLISKASAIVARNYKMDPTDAQQLVSDYVEQAIGNNDLEEGWKSKLAGAALAGAAMLGGAGAHAGGISIGPDGQADPNGFTIQQQQALNQRMSQQQQAPVRGVNMNPDYLQKAAQGGGGRFMISQDDAKAALVWLDQHPDYKVPVPATQSAPSNGQSLGQHYQANPGVREEHNVDAYMMELAAKLAEKIPSDAPVDVWVKDFQKADPSKYHQFKNKTPQKKAQMAAAASYAAKNPSK
jgi:hypothetical protein